MRRGIFTQGSAGFAVLIACLACLPAQAAASTSCTEAALTQPFLAWGDSNWYAPTPGEGYDSFAGSGWTLTGGAQIITTTLYDGTQGSVLDLPAGATAVSPATCVNNTYPYLRTMVRSYSGQVNISLSYATTTGWAAPKPTGPAVSPKPAWALSSKIKLVTGPSSTWQLVKLTLAGTGTRSHNQIYNLFLDPRMKH